MPLSANFLKKKFADVMDRFLIHHRRNTEIKKFKDKRRVEIYKKVVLTKEQKRQIDEFFLENYGKKIPYTWHRSYTAFTGKFDVKYFPELLYVPELEHFMNSHSSYAEVFSDKNVLAKIASVSGVKMPETKVCCIKGMFFDSEGQMIDQSRAAILLEDCGIVFGKPSVDSCSGQGCCLIEIKDGKDLKSGKNVAEVFQELGKDFVIQERIKCHESLSTIYPNSVNTFRIFTYRWKGKIEVCPAILRIGQGGNFLDNAHAGGMFLAVNSDGTLHKTAFTEFRKAFDVHPDTGVVFDGYKISDFSKVVEAAKKVHHALPQLGIINWDFTLNEEAEPILIEANCSGGGCWVFQMAHGYGMFEENTADILKYVKEMKRLPRSERLKKCFETPDVLLV